MAEVLRTLKSRCTHIPHVTWQQQSNKILWNCPMCKLKATPPRVAFLWSGHKATHMEVIGLVIFCMACGAAAVNYSTANSWLGISKTAGCVELSDSEMARQKTNRFVSKPINHLEHTSPCTLQSRQLLQWWERVREKRLWVKVRVHYWTAITWSLLLVCAMHCGREQPQWHHDTCGMACVSLMDVLALKHAEGEGMKKARSWVEVVELRVRWQWLCSWGWKILKLFGPTCSRFISNRCRCTLTNTAEKVTDTHARDRHLLQSTVRIKDDEIPDNWSASQHRKHR